MVSFDTNILFYATLSVPLAKTDRARELLVRDPVRIPRKAISLAPITDRATPSRLRAEI